MNWADWTIIAILVISSLIGLKRGLVKEALSLLCWAAAFVVAITFHKPLATLLESSVATPSLRLIIAFAALFVVTLIVGALVNYLIGELVRITGLSGTDRVLGMVFGLARGAVVIMALVLFLPALLPVKQDLWWQQSVIIPHFTAMEDWALQAGSWISTKLLSFFQS